MHVVLLYSRFTVGEQSGVPMKHYTFVMTCSFGMQFTFTEHEVEPDTGGLEGDVVPTDDALLRLQAELKEYLGQSYSVEKMEVYSDSDALLGVDDDSS